MGRGWLVVALIVVSGTFGLQLHGQEIDSGRSRPEVPHIVINGLIAYRDKGPEEAVKAWVKDSVLDGNANAMTAVDSLRHALNYYGPYRNFEVLTTQDLSRRVRVTYVVMNFDKGPLFGRFMAYRSEDHGWLLLNFDLNMQPEMILPNASSPVAMQTAQ